MDQAVAHLLLSSIKITAIAIGIVRLFGEVFLSYLPFGILITLAIVGCVYYLRVPPPNINVVEAMLGKDLTEVDSGSSQYVVRTVAHRGAGLDVPENTLAAFKMVIQLLKFRQDRTGRLKEIVVSQFGENTKKLAENACNLGFFFFGKTKNYRFLVTIFTPPKTVPSWRQFIQLLI